MAPAEPVPHTPRASPLSRLFLTGATGFIGRRVARALADRKLPAVALVRGGRPLDGAPGLEVIAGELRDPAAWRPSLEGCDTVLHLAAATGAASAAEHDRINHQATRQLADAAQAAGVRRFIFVSSVAAAFPDLRDYPYGRAKLAAETAVRDSGMAAAIVRPTIVAGLGSPILAALAKLALLPVVPVFGSGQVKVQPIWVDDLAAALVEVVSRPELAGTFGLGGREVVTMDELLLAIRRALGRKQAPLIHLPLGGLLPPLRLAERMLGGKLPLTPGQLSSFRFDGTVDNPPELAALTARFLGVDAMLARSFGA